MTYLAIGAIQRRSPPSWEWSPLRRIASLRREANTSGSATLLSLSSDRGLEPRGDDGGRQLPSEALIPSYWLVDPDNVVLNPMWAIGGGVGVSRLQGAVSPAYRVYRLVASIYPRFLDYYLRSVPALAQYNLLVRGITTFDRSVTRQDFEKMPVPCPPLTIQRAIADYLDAETARIDALIEKKRSMVELLDERWRVAVSFRMGQLAERYGVIQLRHLVACLDGARVPLSAVERAHRAGDYPYFGASGIVDQIDGYLFDETLVLLGEDGAQLGDPSSRIAQLVTGRVWVNNHAHVLRPLRVDPEFLVYRLNTFDRVAFMSGGTREKITQDDMNCIPVPNVPLELQELEARRMALTVEGARGTSGAIQRQVELLAERRQALITAAVTGELSIPGVAA